MDLVLEISDKISSFLNTPSLETEQVVRIILDDYKITKSSNEIILYQETLEEKSFKMFFIAKHTEGLSDKSLKYYKERLICIFKSIGKPFLNIDTDDIRMYFAKRGMVDKIAKSTMNNERRVLSSFFSWLAAEEYIIKNPMLRIGSIKEEKRIKKPFTEEEIELLRKNIYDDRGLAMFEFLYSTGVRVSEMITLNIKDVDFEKGCCIVFGKGGKERYVYLNTKSKMALKYYLDSRKDNENALFISQNKKRLLIGGVALWLRNLSLISNVDKVHPHRFRRTAATTALNRGMPMDQVKIMLGHAKIETTTIYAQSSNDNVKQSHTKFLS
jgi:integrase/recombinase XerD